MVAGAPVEPLGAAQVLLDRGRHDQCETERTHRRQPGRGPAQGSQVLRGGQQAHHEEGQQAGRPGQVESVAGERAADEADHDGRRQCVGHPLQQRGRQPPHEKSGEVPHRPVRVEEHRAEVLATDDAAEGGEGVLEDEVRHHDRREQLREVATAEPERPGQVAGHHHERRHVPQVEEVVGPGRREGLGHQRPEVTHHHERDEQQLRVVEPGVARAHRGGRGAVRGCGGV